MEWKIIGKRLLKMLFGQVIGFTIVFGGIFEYGLIQT
jgi:hypothetical protein